MVVIVAETEAEVGVVEFRRGCEEELQSGCSKVLWFGWAQRELENGLELGKETWKNEDGAEWVSVANERPLLSVAFE